MNQQKQLSQYERFVSRTETSIESVENFVSPNLGLRGVGFVAGTISAEEILWEQEDHKLQL